MDKLKIEYESELELFGSKKKKTHTEDTNSFELVFCNGTLRQTDGHGNYITN